MGSMWEDISEFHQKFHINQAELPGFHSDEMMQFRLKFLKEELQEFEDAVMGGDHAGAFDALIDLVYVAMGTAYICNFPFEEGWEHVHQANMSKQRVKKKSASKRGTLYDIVKPDGWVSPEPMLVALLLLRTYEIQTANFRQSLPIDHGDEMI